MNVVRPPNAIILNVNQAVSQAISQSSAQTAAIVSSIASESKAPVGGLHRCFILLYGMPTAQGHFPLFASIPHYGLIVIFNATVYLTSDHVE